MQPRLRAIADGNTVTNDPSTLGGGRIDKHLIYEGLSQVAADAVLSGANTIGGDIVFSVWHPELVRLRAALGKPRHPIQIVATIRGLDLDEHLLFNVPDDSRDRLDDRQRRGRDATGDRRTSVGPADRDGAADDLPAAFQEFRDSRHRPHLGRRRENLATQLVDAGLVQDVYLTTSPLPGGEPGTPFYPRPLTTRTDRAQARHRSGVGRHLRAPGRFDSGGVVAAADPRRGVRLRPHLFW